MTKIRSFLIVFLPAYLLSKILMGLFEFPGFSFNNPSFLALLADLLVWFLSWGVAYIVYATLFRGGRTNITEMEDSANEVS